MPERTKKEVLLFLRDGIIVGTALVFCFSALGSLVLCYVLFAATVGWNSTDIFTLSLKNRVRMGGAFSMVFAVALGVGSLRVDLGHGQLVLALTAATGLYFLGFSRFKYGVKLQVRDVIG